MNGVNNIISTVLKHLSEYGIQVKQENCAFFKDTVEYLEYQISSEGLYLRSSYEIHAGSQLAYAC